MEIKSNSKYTRLFLWYIIDIILVEKIDIYLFKLFVRIYLLLHDCNLMLSDGEYNLLTYLLSLATKILFYFKILTTILIRWTREMMDLSSMVYKQYTPFPFYIVWRP